MISLTVSGTEAPVTPVTMLWRVEPGPNRNPEPEPGTDPTDVFFPPHSDCCDCGVSAGQKTKSLGTPSCPGLQETPEPTF